MSEFSFLVVSIEIGGVHTQVDLIKRVARELRGELSRSEPWKKKAKDVWDFLSKWEILGVRYHRDNQPDPDDLRDSLVDQLASISSALGSDCPGVLILIDEADAAPVEAQLGEFLKSVSERLAKRGVANIIFGLT